MIGWVKGRLKKWIESKGYSVEKTYEAQLRHGKTADLRFGVAEFAIDSILRNGKSPVVVQVGAFDGKSNDFLYDYLLKYDVTAILVEPQPEAFKLLERNYKGVKGAILENAAIAKTDGAMQLFRIKTQYHRSFRLAPQLASFDRQHLLNALSIKHLEGLPDDRNECIESIDVPCLTFGTLLKNHSIQQLDILQIDTEGFDWEIVKMINFNELKPTLINFEIAHLSHSEVNYAIDLLANNGYMTLVYGINMLAIQREGSSVEEHFFEGSTFSEIGDD